MAKIIKLTPDIISEIQQDFAEAVKTAKLSDGKISYTKTFGSITRSAKLFFTETAWAKMDALVREFTKEIAWHGIAARGNDPDKDEYFVSDIEVYPQEVTGANVDTDQKEYERWLYSHTREVFSNIRFQGHSHVNMGVSPSTTDLNLYKNWLDQLDDTMFYIFLILNKKGDKMVKIYDMAKNVLFETSDVKIEILHEGRNGRTLTLLDQRGEPLPLTDNEQTAMLEALRKYREADKISAFIKTAKTMVKEKVNSYPAYTGGAYCGSSYYGGSSGNSYYDGYAGSYGAKTTPSPAPKTSAPAPAAQSTKPTAQTQQTSKQGNKTGGKKKGRRKGTPINLSMYQKKGSYDSYDDDEDDPYGSFGSTDKRGW